MLPLGPGELSLSRRVGAPWVDYGLCECGLCELTFRSGARGWGRWTCWALGGGVFVIGMGGRGALVETGSAKDEKSLQLK
jgi:hypothetical protein